LGNVAKTNLIDYVFVTNLISKEDRKFILQDLKIKKLLNIIGIIMEQIKETALLILNQMFIILIKFNNNYYYLLFKKQLIFI